MAPRVSMETLAKAAYWYYVQDLSQRKLRGAWAPANRTCLG